MIGKPRPPRTPRVRRSLSARRRESRNEWWVNTRAKREAKKELARAAAIIAADKRINAIEKKVAKTIAAALAEPDEMEALNRRLNNLETKIDREPKDVLAIPATDFVESDEVLIVNSNWFAATNHTHATNYSDDAALDVTPGVAGTAGDDDQFSRDDHTHQLVMSDDATEDVTPDVAGIAGTDDHVARDDHTHQLVTYSSPPEPIGTALAGTTATAPSRGDHVHAAALNNLSDVSALTGVGRVIWWNGSIWTHTATPSKPAVLVFDDADGENMVRWENVDTLYKGVFRGTNGDMTGDWPRFH